MVDLNVLVHQSNAAVECEGYIRRIHSSLETVADSIKLSKVSINGFEGMIGFASNLILSLAFGVTLPADDSLVGQTGADIVQCRAPRDDTLILTLEIGEQRGDVIIGSIE